MSSISIKSQIDSLQKQAAGLRDKQRKHSEAVHKAAQNAQRKADQAMRTSSVNTARSYLGQADQETKKSLALEKKANDCAKKVADLERQITVKQQSLSRALKQEQMTADRETQRRRLSELKHAREVARLSRPEGLRLGGQRTRGKPRHQVGKDFDLITHLCQSAQRPGQPNSANAPLERVEMTGTRSAESIMVSGHVKCRVRRSYVGGWRPEEY